MRANLKNNTSKRYVREGNYTHNTSIEAGFKRAFS